MNLLDGLLNSVGIFRKCQICEATGFDKKLRWFESSSWPTVAGAAYRYHHACLCDALSNPEKYSRQIVDLALDIANLVFKRTEEGRQRQERINAVRLHLPSLFWDKLG